MNTAYFYSNNLYTLCYDFENPNYIRIIKNEYEKAIYLKVIENDNYIIKGNKKSISGKGGAKEVFNFLSDTIRNNFMTGYVDKIINDYVEK